MTDVRERVGLWSGNRRMGLGDNLALYASVGNGTPRSTPHPSHAYDPLPPAMRHLC